MKPIDIGYVSLTEGLTQFNGHRHMPMDLNVNRLDDGDGIEATLTRRSVQWLKKCCLKFNKTNVSPVEAGRVDSASEQQSGSSTQTDRTRSADQGFPQSTESICFFCNKPAGTADLHHAYTNEINRNVR